MNLDVTKAIEAELNEIDERAGRDFRADVRDKIEAILRCQGVIAHHQALLKQLRADLKALELRQVDRAAVFGEPTADA